MILNERSIVDEYFNNAKKFLSELLIKDSKNVEARCLLAKLYNHRAKSDHELAKNYAKEALLYDPTNRSLHVRLIEASHGITGDGYIDNHLELINFDKHFITENPAYIMGYIILINQLISDCRFKEAIKDYHKYFDSQEKPRLVDGLCSLASLYEERGEYDKAIRIGEQYRQVLQEDHGIMIGAVLDALS